MLSFASMGEWVFRILAFIIPAYDLECAYILSFANHFFYSLQPPDIQFQVVLYKELHLLDFMIRTMMKEILVLLHITGISNNK